MDGGEEKRDGGREGKVLTLCCIVACLCSISLFSTAESITSWSSWRGGGVKTSASRAPLRSLRLRPAAQAAARRRRRSCAERGGATSSRRSARAVWTRGVWRRRETRRDANANANIVLIRAMRGERSSQITRRHSSLCRNTVLTC